MRPTEGSPSPNCSTSEGSPADEHASKGAVQGWRVTLWELGRGGAAGGVALTQWAPPANKPTLGQHFLSFREAALICKHRGFLRQVCRRLPRCNRPLRLLLGASTAAAAVAAARPICSPCTEASGGPGARPRHCCGPRGCTQAARLDQACGNRGARFAIAAQLPEKSKNSPSHGYSCAIHRNLSRTSLQRLGWHRPPHRRRQLIDDARGAQLTRHSHLAQVEHPSRRVITHAIYTCRALVMDLPAAGRRAGAAPAWRPPGHGRTSDISCCMSWLLAVLPPAAGLWL